MESSPASMKKGFKSEIVQCSLMEEDNKPPSPIEIMGPNCICDNSHDIYGRNIGIPVAEFIRERINQGIEGLKKDFEQLEITEHVEPCKSYNKYEDKNRYDNIFCIENQRVILNGSSPYIHANFVHGYKHSKAFICTQAPMDNTTTDFWRMVWQEKCLIIVSLTRIVEGEWEKCHKYWPAVQYSARRYGKFKITNLDVDSRCSDYDVTFLKMVNTKTKEARCVYHFLHLNWPDFGVPSSSFRFHKFTQEVHKCNAAQRKEIKWWNGCPEGPPIVVHCSAGVGRTGTFCALNILTRKMLDTGKIDLIHCILALRKQRAHSVQKSDQYAFIFLALVEFASIQNLVSLKDVSLVNFVNDFTKYNKIREQALKVAANYQDDKRQ